MNSNILPPFSTLDLTKADCFSSEENKSMESVPLIWNYTEDELANMPIEMDNDMDMSFLFQPNGFEACLTGILIDQEMEVMLSSNQTFTDIGNNQHLIVQVPQEEPKVIVQPINQQWKPLQKITVEQFTNLHLLTPPESVSSYQSFSDDENIIIVCNDNTTKISVSDYKNINENFKEIEQLIKPESKRGRPKRNIEELKKEADNVRDVKKKKTAKNNLASSMYRTKKSEKRKELEEQLKDEIDKFKRLTKEHEKLESDIEKLKQLHPYNTMEEEDEFTDQHSVLVKVAGLYASHLMSDIILVVGENRYPAHRVILSASSDVFQVMLMNPQWSESKESVINLFEDENSAEVFPLFLKYLYTGQVRISVESAMPLLSLADKYNIKDLIVLCRDYMQKSIAKAGHTGVLISWLQYTNIYVHQQLTNELKNFLRINFEMVAYSNGFVNIDPNNLCAILQQNDLVVESEKKLFDIVEHWLMLKREQIEKEESLSDEDKQSHMKSLIEGVCVYIRYPMMSINELAYLPLKPITHLCKEFFCNMIAIGMSFHANQPIKTDSDLYQYTPRLYTSDSFCLEMMVKEIHKVENYETFGACFFSLEKFSCPSESADDNAMQWEIDFFPRGIRYCKAQLINVFNFNPMASQRIEVPESILKTVRVRCTCRTRRHDEIRFKIAVLVSGSQNNITHNKTFHTRVEYFSRENNVINLDNLIPYEELDTDDSIYLVGEGKDAVKIHIIIIPFPQHLTQESPPLEFK